MWLYRFLHSIAGNVTTPFAGKIPGLKTFLLVVMIAGLVAVSSCSARYTVHPGALDKTDSAAHDAKFENTLLWVFLAHTFILQ